MDEDGSSPECVDIFTSENVGANARTPRFCPSAEAKSAALNPQFPTGRKFDKKISIEFPTGRKFSKNAIDIV
jgi:hypothetical protein